MSKESEYIDKLHELSLAIGAKINRKFFFVTALHVFIILVLSGVAKANPMYQSENITFYGTHEAVLYLLSIFSIFSRIQLFSIQYQYEYIYRKIEAYFIEEIDEYDDVNRNILHYPTHIISIQGGFFFDDNKSNKMRIFLSILVFLVTTVLPMIMQVFLLLNLFKSNTSELIYYPFTTLVLLVEVSLLINMKRNEKNIIEKY